MAPFWRDARKRPGFWLASLLTLTLGMGAVVAIFSLIDSILLRPLPFPDADRLVGIRMESLKLRGLLRQCSLPDFEDWRRSQQVFVSLGLHETDRLSIVREGRAFPAQMTRVTPDFFATLGATAAQGRTFLPEEDQPGADANKIVLSHGFWRTVLGGDPSIVGKTLRSGYGTLQVVGIMPPGFQYPSGTQVWLPVQARLNLRKLRRDEDRSYRAQQVVARLKPGIGLEQAAEQMRALATELERRHPATNEAMRPVLDPLREIEAGGMRRYLALLMVAVCLLLAIAVLNVANLMLVRVAGRMRELTLRGALGAPARALIQGPVTESLVLALTGWCAGLGLAWVALRQMPGWIPVDLPSWVRLEISPVSLLVTLAIALLAALGTSLFPARAALRVNAAEVLRESGRGVAGHPRVQTWLVAGEVALAFALLVAAGLLVKSFRALETVEHGLDPARVMTLKITPNVPGQNEERVRRSTQLIERLTRRLAELPGVEAVGGTDLFPFTPNQSSRRTIVMEARGDAAERQHRAPSNLIDVTPGYFAAAGIQVREGRAFRDDEDLTKPWTIILSERAARAMFPGRGALGQQVRMNSIGSQDPWATVVGVVENVKYRADDSEQSLEFYYPAKQYGLSETYLAVRFRRDLTPGDAVALREAVQREDPETPVEQIKPMVALMADTLWQPRLWSHLLAGFALLAGLLSAIGLYGVLSYSVELRRQEIGVRMALGAEPRGIAAWMTGRGLRTVGYGLLAGFVLAAGGGRLMEGLLFGVAWWDPAIYGLAVASSLGVGVVACQIPARRASRVDPLAALRDD
jgi:putative ABC transport system permease protein